MTEYKLRIKSFWSSRHLATEPDYWYVQRKFWIFWINLQVFWRYDEAENYVKKYSKIIESKSDNKFKPKYFNLKSKKK